jgi:AAA family ATP:ADP antiporter
MNRVSMPEQKSPLEKLLSFATNVRPGEGTGVVLLTLNIFLLLGAYYLLKTVREALILSEGSAEVKSYSSAGQAALLLLIIPAYGALTSRLSRMRVMMWVFLIFISNLLLFYFFGLSGSREGIVFYIWVGIFNNFAVAQFWSFANDLYTTEQGKRLFPAIGIGMATGAVAGAAAAGPFIQATGPYPLMLAAAAVLVVCLALTYAANRGARSQPRQYDYDAGRDTAPLAKVSVWELLRRHRYLQLIAILIVLLNVVNTTGEFLLGKFVTAEAARTVGAALEAREKFIGEFYANFYFWVNVAGMLLQTFAVSRIFKYLGVRGSLFILPLIALCNYSLLLALPLLAVVRVGKILENGTDYSIMNTTRQALYLPTSREAKYKVKSAIDTFFVRGGDMLHAGLVYVGTQFGLGVTGFSGVNVVLTLAWLGVAVGLARQPELKKKLDAAA